MKKTMIILLVLLCSLSVFLFAEGNSTQIQKEESSREEIKVTVGDGDLLDGALPICHYFRSSLFEQIYYAEELQVKGVLNAIEFYYNFSVLPDVTDINIWVGETTETDLSEGYIPAGELTQVYSGPVKYLLGEGVAHIQLDTTYTYAGGNLVVLTQRPLDDKTYGQSDQTQFYTTPDEAHPDRTIWTVGYSTEVDPYNPIPDKSDYSIAATHDSEHPSSKPHCHS